MPRSTFFRAAFLLVLVLAVAVPSLQAAPREEAPVARGAWELVTQAWDYLVGVWSANGCGLDPSGSCQPRPIATNAENGCGLDPDGRCGR